MKYDTAGNQTIKPIPNCDCGLTNGCKKCYSLPSFIGCISDEEAKKMKKKVKDFRDKFDKDINERSLSHKKEKKSIPVFVCRKCGHRLFLTSGKMEKLINYDCPNCGEEGEELWIFSFLAKKYEKNKPKERHN